MNLAWLAGFVDGEGSFCLLRRKNRKAGVYTPSIIIYNSHLPTLDLIREWKQPSGFYCAQRNIKWKPVGSLYYSNNKAIELSLMLIPYLVVKHRHAEILLEYNELEHFQGGARGGLDQKHIAVREILFNELRELNKRGANDASQVDRAETIFRNV